MSITLLEIDSRDVTVSMREALRYMGVRGDAPDVLAVAEALLPEVLDASGAKVCFGEYPVKFGDGFVEVGGIVTESDALRKNLEGCSSAVIFAATAGIGVDRLIAKYSKLAPSKAVMVSAIGSAFIEGICDKFCDGLAEQYAKIGKCIKPRFSPGYGGFDLSAQREIACLLGTEKRVGLYFTDSLMMIPEKSVTAIVGIYDKAKDAENV